MRVWFAIISTILVLCILIGLMGIIGRSNCMCSILTHQEERYPITSHLNSIWDISSADEGIFIRLIVTCEHGKRIYATIYPDEGYYTGYMDE